MKKEPKFLNIMKISTFLLSACAFSTFAAPTSSQNMKGNIDGNEITIDESIDPVGKQADDLSVYNKNEVNNASPVAQQGKVVKGVVKDMNGEPVIGANVVVKGTTNGTITDIDGNYSLEGVPAGAILQISYIGYLTKDVTVGNQSAINVILAEDTQSLDEVVVVGYGTMRKSDVTGSIGVAKGEDLTKNQNFSALENLRGKVSGVNIFSNSSQPGAYNNRVIIRGMATINSSSDPLYVVDGVVMENFGLVNPNDIESMEVLKDASATAIYGARGANGVIMVTTKRGKKGGEGVQISGIC